MSRLEASPRIQFSFAHMLRVRWSEVDLQGIVFNPNYFVYADVGFAEYMRAIGLAYPDELHAAGSDLFMVSAAANFRDSARYDDELEVAVRAAAIGRTSLTLEIQIARDGSLLVLLKLTYVNADRKSQRAETLPIVVVNRIVAFERIAPTRAS